MGKVKENINNCLWFIRRDPNHKPFCIRDLDGSINDRVNYSFNCEACKSYEPIRATRIKKLYEEREPYTYIDENEEEPQE